jgi:phage-related minor tail protein
VTGGVPYLVGERGPEMFVPQGNGSIVPNKVMKGGGHTIIVNVNGSNNAPDVRRAAGQGAREALGLFDGARRYV